MLKYSMLSSKAVVVLNAKTRPVCVLLSVVLSMQLEIGMMYQLPDNESLHLEKLYGRDLELAFLSIFSLMSDEAA